MCILFHFRRETVHLTAVTIPSFHIGHTYNVDGENDHVCDKMRFSTVKACLPLPLPDALSLFLDGVRAGISTRERKLRYKNNEGEREKE
jgi:hypothetical protein